jgi:hypothetical protein
MRAWISRLALALASFAAVPVPAQPITFMRIADTSTPVPGGSGNFQQLWPASVQDGNILFQGAGSAGQQGIYRYDAGGITRLVDTSTPIPNGSGTFNGIGSPLIHEETFAFRGFGPGRVLPVRGRRTAANRRSK